jgi:hypothetical protein
MDFCFFIVYGFSLGYLRLNNDMPRIHQLGEVSRMRLADCLATLNRAPHSTLGEEIAAILRLESHLPHAPAVAAILVRVCLRHPFDVRIVRELALAPTLRIRRGNARFVAADTLRVHLCENLAKLLELLLRELRELRLHRLHELSAEALNNQFVHAIDAVSDTTEMGADPHDVVPPGMTLRHSTLRQKLSKATNLPHRDALKMSHFGSKD